MKSRPTRVWIRRMLREQPKCVAIGLPSTDSTEIDRRLLAVQALGAEHLFSGIVPVPIASAVEAWIHEPGLRDVPFWTFMDQTFTKVYGPRPRQSKLLKLPKSPRPPPPTPAERKLTWANVGLKRAKRKQALANTLVKRWTRRVKLAQRGVNP